MWTTIDLKGKWYYLLYPRPVVIITARYGGRESGMAASWVMPISRSPPLVGVSIAPTRFTYELLSKSKEFAINVLDYEHVDVVNYLGTVSGRNVPDKLRKCGVRIGNAKRISAPIIEDSAAILECKVFREFELGDHVLVVGEVIEAYAKEPLRDVPDVKKYREVLQIAGTMYTTTITEYRKL